MSLFERFAEALIRRYQWREPDERVGRPDAPMYLRWKVLPRNRFFNIYLHQWQRSDEDRALHDHPWPNFTLVLSGEVVEHTIAEGGIHHRQKLRAGDWHLRLRAG